MKFLIFILCIAMSVPSWALLSLDPTSETNPGKGLPSGTCSYDQKNIEPAEPESVVAIKKELEAAKKELREIEAKLRKVDCDECENIVRRALEKVDPINEELHIRHISGGSDCRLDLISTNVDVYNFWADTQGWSQIEMQTIESPNRMIAGDGNSGSELGDGAPVEGQCRHPETGRLGWLDENNNCVVENTSPPGLDAPSLTCKYGQLNHSLKMSLCSDAFSERTQSRRLCDSCIKLRGSRKESRLGRCLQEKIYLEQREANLIDKIDDLEWDLEDERKYVAENGITTGSGSNGGGQFKTAFNNIAPILLGGLGGYFLGKKFYNKQKDAVLEDDEIRKRQGYPIAGGSSVDPTGAIVLGLGTGYGIYGLAKGSGFFGCADSRPLSGLTGALGGISGSLEGSIGGSGGGLGGILGDLLGGNKSDSNGGLNGQINGNGGFVIGPNGQLIPSGSGNMNIPSQAQIEAEIRANQQRLDALTNYNAQLAGYYNYQNSILAIQQRTAAEIRAIPQVTPPSGDLNSILSGGAYANGNSGVLSGGLSSGVLQGGVTLNASLRGSLPRLSGGLSGNTSYNGSAGGNVRVGTNFNPNVQPTPRAIPSNIRGL